MSCHVPDAKVVLQFDVRRGGLGCAGSDALSLDISPATDNELEQQPKLKPTIANTHLSLAPYERRVIELLRNSKDKRARKLAKKRVRRSPFRLLSNGPRN